MGRAGKNTFDKDAAFRSIVGAGAGEQEAAAQIRASAEAPQGKGRPKVTDRETKKRISLAVFPSVYADLQKIAYVDRQSVSDVVTALIAEYVEANKETVKEYDKIKGE